MCDLKVANHPAHARLILDCKSLCKNFNCNLFNRRTQPVATDMQTLSSVHEAAICRLFKIFLFEKFENTLTNSTNTVV